MQAIIHPKGTQFGSLSVIALSPERYKGGKLQFDCQCICGNTLTVLASNLRRGNTTSCGCQKRKLISDWNLRHGHARIGKVTPTYRSYQKAKDRCENPTDAAYDRYGGRGIEFRFETFEEFFACVGDRPSPHHSIDRIDNSGHYETGNIRWATPTEQSRNRRSCVMVTFNGITKTVTEWAEDKGINCVKARKRMKRGWCHECSFNNSVRKCTHQD